MLPYIAYMDPMGTVIHFSGYHIEIQSSLHCREATRLPMHRYALVGNGPLGEGTFGLVWRRRNMTSFTKCPALVAPRMIEYGSSWDSGCGLDHCTNSLHCAGARQSLPKWFGKIRTTHCNLRSCCTGNVVCNIFRISAHCWNNSVASLLIPLW